MRRRLILGLFHDNAYNTTQHNTSARRRPMTEPDTLLARRYVRCFSSFPDPARGHKPGTASKFQKNHLRNQSAVQIIDETFPHKTKSLFSKSGFFDAPFINILSSPLYPMHFLSHLFSSPFLSCSLLPVATQDRGYTEGSSPPSPLRY